jgi:hydroxyacylglutathione hydrolase
MHEEVVPLRVKKFLFFINYTYVIVDRESRDAIVIDPAWKFKTIESELSNYDARPIAVLLTHSHFDHVLLAKKFVKKFNGDVYMSKEEIDGYNFRCKNLHSFDRNGRHMIGSMPVDVWVTPGHTSGSTCYGIGDNLFTGDTLFIEGCGLCWGKGADPKKMFYSLDMLKKTIPGHYRVFPGHSYGEKPGATFEYIKLNNIYLQFTDISQFVEFRMRKKQKGLFAFK